MVLPNNELSKYVEQMGCLNWLLSAHAKLAMESRKFHLYTNQIAELDLIYRDLKNEYL